MKLLFVAVALIASIAAPSLAHAAPVEAAPMAASRLSLDTPIEQIVADDAGKAVITANFPDMMAHPAFEQFKAMSLKQLQPMAQGAITDEALAKASAALATIK
jgi:hypothetical protein